MTGRTASRVAGRATRVIAALVLLAGAARAQAPAAPEPGSELTVDVITFGQGEEVWERFGHNALRVRDERTGSDLAYNWGMFDFNQPNFLGRFLTGDTRYWMEGIPTQDLLMFYQRIGRSATVQHLNLTPAQRLAVQQFVQWNSLEENKWYRYDYYRDNCSTRLRDAVDRAVGGALRAATQDTTAFTYRTETLRLLDAMPFTQAGTDVALGHPASRPITTWEAGFIPMRLQAALRRVKVRAADGTMQPLVASEQVLYPGTHGPEAERAPSLAWRYLAVGLLLAAIFVALGWYATGATGARVLLGIAGSLWALVTGLLGVVLLLAWTVTRHVFWYRNENLFQFEPISLALVVLVPLALARPRLARRAATVAGVVAAIAVLGLLVKVLPWFRQPNVEVIALTLPAHVALAWAMPRLARQAALR